MFLEIDEISKNDQAIDGVVVLLVANRFWLALFVGLKSPGYVLHRRGNYEQLFARSGR